MENITDKKEISQHKINCSLYMIFVFSLQLLISSCGVLGNFSETLYLQQAGVKSPVIQPPTNLSDTTNRIVMFSPKIFINSSKRFEENAGKHTRVNHHGVFQVDTIRNSNGTYEYRETAGANINSYSGKNFSWETPNYSIGLDVDFKISGNAALSFGINNCSISKENLSGYRAGIGFFSAKDGLGFRFDLGVQWQEVVFDASSVVVQSYDDIFSSPKTLIFFMRDIKEETYFNYYFGLTFNSYSSKWPLGFFVNLGFVKQKLLDFEPSNYDEKYFLNLFTPITYQRTDTRQDFAASFLSISPGIYFSINQWSRISFSMRYSKNIDDSANKSFFHPMLQFDLTL